jgi:hypothetical protein
MIGNIKKFSFSELTSNNSGKTSGSGTSGLFICLIGAITFAFGCFIKAAMIIDPSVIVITIGAGLLGYRKSQEANTDVVATDKTDVEVTE